MDQFFEGRPASHAALRRSRIVDNGLSWNVKSGKTAGVCAKVCELAHMAELQEFSIGAGQRIVVSVIVLLLWCFIARSAVPRREW